MVPIPNLYVSFWQALIFFLTGMKAEINMAGFGYFFTTASTYLAVYHAKNIFVYALASSIAVSTVLGLCLLTAAAKPPQEAKSLV